MFRFFTEWGNTSWLISSLQLTSALALVVFGLIAVAKAVALIG